MPSPISLWSRNDRMTHLMTRQKSLTLAPPTRGKPQAGLVVQRLWHWFIEPSSKITELDQRRQAALLTGFILGLIVLAIMLEAVTILLLNDAGYTGYRQTIISVMILALVYTISRTQYVQLAGILAVVVTSLAIFLIGWSKPSGIQNGWFDFLLLPLWLGSLFIDLKKLPFLITGELVGLLVFPLVVPQVTFNDILIGPFSFVVATSLLLIIITHHRNNLERDRQSELSSKEQRSRREAARAHALLRAAHRLNAQLDPEVLLAAISEEVARALSTPVAIVALYSREQKHLAAAAGVGLSPDLIKSLPPLSRRVYNEMVKAHGAVFSLPDLQLLPSFAYLNPFRKENLRSMAFTTMHYEHELIGSLAAFTLGDQRDFTKDELLLLQGLADQAALALVNTRLNDELLQAYESTIEGWSWALDLRDKETEGHSQRVMEMTVRLARHFGMGTEEIAHVSRGALLHDIGKMGVPDAILLKPDKLTDEEWVIMRKHPQNAYDMLKAIAYLRPALDIPYCHHEKWDGTGYPRRLIAGQIPLAARLFAVVDVWDALRADRPYRPAWSEEKVVAHIKALSGTHFDPQVVEHFLALLVQP